MAIGMDIGIGLHMTVVTAVIMIVMFIFWISSWYNLITFTSEWMALEYLVGYKVGEMLTPRLAMAIMMTTLSKVVVGYDFECVNININIVIVIVIADGIVEIVVSEGIERLGRYFLRQFIILPRYEVIIMVVTVE